MTDIQLPIPAVAETDLPSFLLRQITKGKITFREDISDRVTSIQVERSMDVSTLTLVLLDPEYQLEDSGLLAAKKTNKTPKRSDETNTPELAVIDVRFDDRWFRLAQVSRDGESLTLTFEDRAVKVLKRHKRVYKWNRDAHTRAEFVEHLVRKVEDTAPAFDGIGFFSPEKHKKQYIRSAGGSDRLPEEDRQNARERGISETAKLKVQGADATDEQRANMEIALDVATDRNAGPRATKALIVAGIGESGFKVGAVSSAGARGVWQFMPATLRGNGITYTNTKRMAEIMLDGGPGIGHGGLIAAARNNPDWSVGELAAKVEVSDGSVDYYQGFSDEADKIIEAYGGISKGTTSVELDYYYQVEDDEDWWACIKRLGDEVRWAAFIDIQEGQPVLTFMPEAGDKGEHSLINSKPRATLNRNDVRIVNRPSYDWDSGKEVGECELDVICDRWDYTIGTCVEIEGFGPCDGRWLIETISRDIANPYSTLQLKQPIQDLAEPAAEREEQDVGRAALEEEIGGSSVEKVYQRALKISDQNLPYVWGGGHAKAGQPSGGGYDCSGYVAACLLAGNMLPSEWKTNVPASGTFASSWGKPGKGKHMTVWANAGHIWIEFNISGKDGKRADTSPHGSGGLGPHMRYTDRSTAGFTPRHWEAPSEDDGSHGDDNTDNPRYGGTPSSGNNDFN